MQLRTRDSQGQGKYGSANIAVSEDGSVGFPPTSRNTLAEGVLHCEAYITCKIGSSQTMAFFLCKLAEPAGSLLQKNSVPGYHVPLPGMEAHQ